jgi:hypothetical protein
MINFSPTVVEVLAQPTIESFYLVRVLDGATVMYSTTSYFRDITLSNGTIYYSDGRLLSVDTPQLSSSVDRELYKIAIADPDFNSSEAADAGLVGKQVEVRLCFVSHITKNPLTNIADCPLVYKGTVEGTNYTIETATVGESVLSISCSSPMSDLDLRRPIYLSKDTVSSRNPLDTCCDQIYEGSGQLTLKWGKV